MSDFDLPYAAKWWRRIILALAVFWAAVAWGIVILWPAG